MIIPIAPLAAEPASEPKCKPMGPVSITLKKGR